MQTTNNINLWQYDTSSEVSCLCSCSSSPIAAGAWDRTMARWADLVDSSEGATCGMCGRSVESKVGKKPGKNRVTIGKHGRKHMEHIGNIGDQ